MSSLFYTWGNWGTERLNNLPKAYQLKVEELGIEPREAGFGAPAAGCKPRCLCYEVCQRRQGQDRCLLQRTGKGGGQKRGGGQKGGGGRQILFSNILELVTCDFMGEWAFPMCTHAEIGLNEIRKQWASACLKAANNGISRVNQSKQFRSSSHF